MQASVSVSLKQSHVVWSLKLKRHVDAASLTADRSYHFLAPLFIHPVVYSCAAKSEDASYFLETASCPKPITLASAAQWTVASKSLVGNGGLIATRTRLSDHAVT